MEKAVFDTLIDDLEQITTPLTEEQRRIYYEHLKKWPSGYITKAVRALIQTYRAKRFPSIPVFRRVLDHIEVEEQKPTREEVLQGLDYLPCPSCHDRGWWVEYREDDDWGIEANLPRTPHYVAVYCQCRHGVKRKEGIESFRKIQHRIIEKVRERAKEEPPDNVFEEDKT